MSAVMERVLMLGSKYNDAHGGEHASLPRFGGFLCFAGDLARRATPESARPEAGRRRPGGAIRRHRAARRRHPLRQQPARERHGFRESNGTADKPRKSIPSPLAAGDVVEVRGGPYEFREASWVGEGTRSAPVFIKGVSDPVIRANRLVFGGTFFAVEGLISTASRW